MDSLDRLHSLDRNALPWQLEGPSGGTVAGPYQRES